MPGTSSNSVKVRYALSKGKVEKILSEYLRRLQMKYDLKLFILFGSFAKGNYTYRSDIDVFIVASDLPKDLSKRFSALLDLDLPAQIQPFGYTTQEFTQMMQKKHPFLTEVLRKGRILFSAPNYNRFLKNIAHKNA